MPEPDRPRIRLACSDFSFLSLPHELALDVIAGIGADGADISLMRGYSHLPVDDVLASPAGWGQRVSQRLRERNLATADVNFLPGGDFEKLAVNHPDAGERDTARGLFRRAIEFTSAAGGSHLTMLPGVPWPAESVDQSLTRAADELAWRVAEGAAAGITVSVEAHVGSIVPTPPETWELLGRVPGLTLTLDLTHFVSQGFDLSHCLPLLQRSSHFHARGGAPGMLQAPREEDVIDYARVLQAMNDFGYAGYFEAEFEWNEWGGCNRVDVLSESILMLRMARPER